MRHVVECIFTAELMYQKALHQEREPNQHTPRK